MALGRGDGPKAMSRLACGARDAVMLPAVSYRGARTGEGLGCKAELPGRASGVVAGLLHLSGEIAIVGGEIEQSVAAENENDHFLPVLFAAADGFVNHR